MTLTLAIITYNEEHRIREVIESVPFATEVIVLDSGSTDLTCDVATALGATVISADWPGYGAQKNRALDASTSEWILSLDADEVASPELGESIRKLLTSDPSFVGYSAVRRNHWLGKPLKGGAYGPRSKLRLVRRGCGRWVGGILHETLEVRGAVGTLDGVIEHYPYRDVSDFLSTATTYAGLFAQKCQLEGRRAYWWDPLFRPILHFVKSFLLNIGFIDGLRGFQLARLGALEVRMKWSKTYMVQKRGLQDDPRD
tara:strand:- start:180 stop:947 length:768 start_codon:yes stop_codon:yes gene_type:complete